MIPFVRATRFEYLVKRTSKWWAVVADDGTGQVHIGTHATKTNAKKHAERLRQNAGGAP